MYKMCIRDSPLTIPNKLTFILYCIKAIFVLESSNDLERKCDHDF